MDAKLRLDHSLVAVEAEGVVHGLLELRAPAARLDAGRPKLGIALVIDRSGSMSGEKLSVAKSCAKYLADRLTPDDRMAVLAYDDQVSLVAGLQGADQHLRAAIDQIGPGGSTNLSGGWLKGVEVLEAASTEVRRVLLLTDGLANVGITDADQLSSMCASAAGRGVITTTIGFGNGFDEELLSAMSDAGRGRDHFAASPEEAPKIFAQEFDGLAAMAIQNLSVEIRPLPETSVVAILNEYPITSVESGLQAALGDLFGGEQRKLIFNLVVPAMADLGPVPVAEVVIRWIDITSESLEMHTRTLPISVNVVPPAEATVETADLSVTEEVVILEAAKARKEARKLAESGDFERARSVLKEQTERLSSIAPSSALFGEATDDIDELERFSQRLEMRTYDQIDSKELWDQSRRRQRTEEYRKRPDRP